MAIEIVGPYQPDTIRLPRTFEPFTTACNVCQTELRVTEPGDMRFIRHTDYSGDTSTYLDITCPQCGATVTVEHYNGRHGHPVQIVNDLIREGQGHLINAAIPNEVRHNLWAAYITARRQ